MSDPVPHISVYCSLAIGFLQLGRQIPKSGCGGGGGVRLIPSLFSRHICPQVLVVVGSSSEHRTPMHRPHNVVPAPETGYIHTLTHRRPLSAPRDAHNHSHEMIDTPGLKNTHNVTRAQSHRIPPFKKTNKRKTNTKASSSHAHSPQHRLYTQLDCCDRHQDGEPQVRL